MMKNDCFQYYSDVVLTKETCQLLREPTFDNWQWEDEEMLLLLQQMYLDLELPRKFDIEINILRNFLVNVYHHYNDVPFHNFRHCFCVTQMVRKCIIVITLMVSSAPKPLCRFRLCPLRQTFSSALLALTNYSLISSSSSLIDPINSSNSRPQLTLYASLTSHKTWCWKTWTFFATHTYVLPSPNLSPKLLAQA